MPGCLLASHSVKYTAHEAVPLSEKDDTVETIGGASAGERADKLAATTIQRRRLQRTEPGELATPPD